MKRDADFLKKVKKLAVENNMSATAKALNMPIYTLKARLLSVTTKLREVPPEFVKTRVSKKIDKAKKRKLIDKVRAVGRGGSSKRVIIPQFFFEELNWNKGDDVVIRLSGKNKIIVEKPVSK